MSAEITPAKFVLWNKPRGRGARWMAVATADSEAELTPKIGLDGKSGSWLTLPVGQHPDDLPGGKNWQRAQRPLRGGL
jgi:hypothetical protein